MVGVTPQSHPETPAGQPEGDTDRLALLDRLLAQRFPGMARDSWPQVDVTRPGVVPLWTPTG